MLHLSFSRTQDSILKLAKKYLSSWWKFLRIQFETVWGKYIPKILQKMINTVNLPILLPFFYNNLP